MIYKDWLDGIVTVVFVVTLVVVGYQLGLHQKEIVAWMQAHGQVFP